MMRILFVDDEPGILEGLRNALRRERQRWHMVFAASGDAALSAFNTEPFDAIICDMRMPQMDGADLLALMRVAHPAAARVVLSGHAERDAVLRALPVAHQYLCKPCETARLREVIEGLSALHDLLPDPALRAALGGMNRLPSSPAACAALAQVLRDPAGGIGAVAAIVERDAAMSARLLQLANSGFFGEGRATRTAREAVARLGLDLLRQLVLEAEIFKPEAGAAETPLPEPIDTAQLPLALGRVAMRSCRPAQEIAPALATAAGSYLFALWGLSMPGGAAQAEPVRSAA